MMDPRSRPRGEPAELMEDTNANAAEEILEEPPYEEAFDQRKEAATRVTEALDGVRQSTTELGDVMYRFGDVGVKFTKALTELEEAIAEAAENE